MRRPCDQPPLPVVRRHPHPVRPGHSCRRRVAHRHRAAVVGHERAGGLQPVCWAFRDINAQIEASGAIPLLEDFVEFLDERAKSVGEGHLQNAFALGFEGGCGLDIPALATDVVAPWLVVDWFLELYNFILGIEEQKRLFEL